MNGYHASIEKLTLQNQNFRQVLYTTPHCQLVVMSLKPGEDIGKEVHAVDQFFRFEKGQAMVVMNGEERQAGDGDVAIVPAGTEHNIINASQTEPLKLYTIYAPPNHKDGTVHPTKADAERDDEHYTTPAGA